MRSVYLDNGATTPLLPEVREAMLPYLGDAFGNPSALHTCGEPARDALEVARGQVAALIGARDDEIIFTASGTESNNFAIKGLAQSQAKKGKHVVISAIEHFSAFNSANTLEKWGYSVTKVPVDGHAQVDPEAIRRAIREDTVLVSVMHANSEVGSLQPIAEIGKITKVKKVIYAESSALYEGSELFPTPEWDVKPQSFYALSKTSAMLFAEGFARFHNMTSTALRYFCVYGPRQDYRRTIPPVFSSFIIKLLKGEQPTIYGTGEKRRDFIHVDDINNFHFLCMEDDRTNGKVFNLGSGENYSINEIYRTIASLLYSDKKPKHLNDLPGEAFANLADITEAKRIGWLPQIGIQEGLQSSIDFIREEFRKGDI